MAILDLQEAIDLIDKGTATEAIPLLTAWTQQMPTYVAAHVVLARAYEAAEQWDEATLAWQEAYFLMPNSPAVTEGLARMRTVAAPSLPTDDRLMMDLDLQAELEAILEALFNPFTPPHQAEAPVEAAVEEPAVEQENHEEDNDEEDNEAFAMVEAALAAAADPEDEVDIVVEAPTDEEELFLQDEVFEEPEEVEEESALQAEAVGVAEPREVDDQPSIYDEIEQLIEEKEGRNVPEGLEEEAPLEAAEPVPQAVAEVVELSEEAALLEETELPEEVDDQPSIYDEIEQLIELKESVKQDIPEEEADAVLGGWQEFEEESTEAPAPEDQDLADLERLISELESARIVPQPELEEIAPPDLTDDIEDVVSETLARIFASQEQYSEAARVYEQLALQHPEEAERFNQLAAEMHDRSGE